jgi:AraC family transcriptional regulator
MHHLENENNVFLLKVLAYIHQNLSGDLNLERLSGVASYSPFHFQRLFTRLTGESPKQYIIRLRLERAAHYMTMFPKMSLSDLSVNTGFSSLSTFSRAFKAYFSISPEIYRHLPSDEISKISKALSKKSKISDTVSDELWKVKFMQNIMEDAENEMEVTVKRMNAKRLICQQTCLDAEDAITIAFRKLYTWADARAQITSSTRYIGSLLDIPFITPLDKCRYRACITAEFIPSENGACIPGNFEQGTYASYVVKGDLFAVLKSLVWFSHQWVPDSGYSIGDITGYEIFSENPANKPVEQITREILIPIKPA